MTTSHFAQMFTRARYDIAHFASMVLNRPLSAEQLALVRRMGPQPDGSRADSLTTNLLPRQSGASIILQIVAAHAALFMHRDKVIGYLAGNEIQNKEAKRGIEEILTNFMIQMRDCKDWDLSGASIDKERAEFLSRIKFFNATTFHRAIRGHTLSLLLVDNASMLTAETIQGLADLYTLFSKYARVHLVNTGYNTVFQNSAFDKYTKYHVTGKMDADFDHYVRLMGRDLAIKEMLCVHPQALIPANTYLKAL